RRLTGGKRSRCGTPQGGVVSPLLANLYMNRFLKHWRFTGCGEAFRAQIIAYADDFVILSRGHAVEAMMWTKAVMTRLRLSLNEAKTSIRDAGTIGIFVCEAVFRHASTKRSLNITANCVFASNHSRGGRFQSAAADSRPNIAAWPRRRQMGSGLWF